MLPTVPACTGPVLEVRDRSRGALTIDEGERVVLAGPSEAGKTAWVRSLVGLGQSFDEIRIDGALASRDQVRASVGLVSESGGVLASLTVRENVAAIPGLPALPGDRVEDVLDLLGFRDRGDRLAGELTPNERRRLALARVLALRRPIVVVDGELDLPLHDLLPAIVEGAPWVRATLRTTCVIDDQAWAADALALLVDGRIAACGPVADLRVHEDPLVRLALEQLMSR